MATPPSDSLGGTGPMKYFPLIWAALEKSLLALWKSGKKPQYSYVLR